jgi:hypothetical protein
LLRKGQNVASYLHSTDKENEVHTIASRWLNVWCTRLETFGERLTLDDAMVEDEATQAGARARSSYATDEPELSSRQRRRRRR